MYGDFTVKHFHEKVVKQHGYRLGYTTTCLGLHRSGRVQPAKGTASSFRGLAETFCAKGLFCSLYTDRGSHYFHTPEAGGKVSKIQLTQVGRALRDLGIEHIPAYSPEARGRSERLFRILQDRLVNELALAGITSIGLANRFIAEVYIPQHNERFAVTPEDPTSAWVPCRPEQWRDVLCRRESRQTGNDIAGHRQGRRLPIPPLRLRPHFAKTKVQIHELSYRFFALVAVRLKPGQPSRTGAISPTPALSAQGSGMSCPIPDKWPSSDRVPPPKPCNSPAKRKPSKEKSTVRIRRGPRTAAKLSSMRRTASMTIGAPMALARSASSKNLAPPWAQHEASVSGAGARPFA